MLCAPGPVNYHPRLPGCCEPLGNSLTENAVLSRHSLIIWFPSKPTPVRKNNRRKAYAEKWWQYAEARPGMRFAIKIKTKYIATPGVSKYRIFVWINKEVLCNQGTLVFARDDDYFLGVLHSRLHEIWALNQGTSLEDRPRYTLTTTFETFPFPWPPGKESAGRSAGESHR